MIGKNLFWDSCVFIRYVTNDVGADHFNDIARFVGEAKAGKRQNDGADWAREVLPPAP